MVNFILLIFFSINYFNFILKHTLCFEWIIKYSTTQYKILHQRTWLLSTIHRYTWDNGALLALTTCLWIFSICLSAGWRGGELAEVRGGVRVKAGAGADVDEECRGLEQTPDVAISNSIPSGSTHSTNLLWEVVVLKTNEGRKCTERSWYEELL